MVAVLTDPDEQVLVRRVVTVVCGVALLTVPLVHYGLGAVPSWISVVHLLVLGGAFAALGRTRFSTRQVVGAAAVLLWLGALASVSATGAATASGASEGVALGTGMLWLAVGVAPALFLVLDVRRAVAACLVAVATFVGALGVVSGFRVGWLLARPGLWQVVVSTLVVIGATATVAWLAGRTADELRLARLLQRERAERTARLEQGQRRRAALFSRAAKDLRAPMQALTDAAAAWREEDDVPDGRRREALTTIERLAGALRDQVAEEIDALVAGTQHEPAAAEDDLTAVEPLPELPDAPARVTSALIALGAVVMVALDAGQIMLLADAGELDAHVVAAGANRMIVVLFLATAVFAVRFPGRPGWVLTAVVAGIHPLVLVAVGSGPARDALLVPFVAAWRVSVFAAAMLAVLAAIIERHVQDRDDLVAAASDEDARREELRRRQEATELAYAEAVHELKNPLTVVQAAAGTLSLRGAALPDDEVDRLRAAVTRAIDRLATRLAVMRDVAGPPLGDREQGSDLTGTSADRPTAAADVLLDALAAARDSLGDRSIDVDVRVTGDWTSAPPAAVEQVLENLLTNACKYGEPDTVLRLTAHRDDRDIVVEVANRGGDLTRTEAARIFEPYWRAANADDRADGSGLGLAVVARLVEQWDGRCWARVSGAWTRVGFTMPVAASVQAPTWQQLQDQLP